MCNEGGVGVTKQTYPKRELVHFAIIHQRGLYGLLMAILVQNPAMISVDDKLNKQLVISEVILAPPDRLRNHLHLIRTP
jgi:hypothetical protein